MSSAWPHSTKLPQGHLHAAGKLNTSSARDQPLEVEKSMVHVPDTLIFASPVTPTGGYRVVGSVNGIDIVFVGHRCSSYTATGRCMVTGFFRVSTALEAVVGSEPCQCWGYTINYSWLCEFDCGVWWGKIHK